MSEEKLLELLTDVMEIEDDTKLTIDTKLEDCEEWDSLTMLSLTVILKRDYQIGLTSDAFASFKDVSDVLAFINSRI